MRQYRILSWQASDAGRAIYCLLPGNGPSVRILINRAPDWAVDKMIQLDEVFVEANREP